MRQCAEHAPVVGLDALRHALGVDARASGALGGVVVLGALREERQSDELEHRASKDVQLRRAVAPHRTTDGAVIGHFDTFSTFYGPICCLLTHGTSFLADAITPARTKSNPTTVKAICPPSIKVASS